MYNKEGISTQLYSTPSRSATESYVIKILVGAQNNIGNYGLNSSNSVRPVVLIPVSQFIYNVE